MSRQKKSYVGKIGYCSDKVLGIKDRYGRNTESGHYVYIREMKSAKKCNVNIVTSLEDERGYCDFKKLNKVKRGYLYPVPKSDSNFTRWSAINLDGNVNDVKISDIQNIGNRKIKRRHKWFVGKFTKK